MTTLLRFQDLVARGVVRNRVTLKRMIERNGFPRGVMISTNTRAWDLDERWIASRSSTGPPARGAAARRQQRTERDRNIADQ
jgi:hypothetical protein